MSTDNFKGLKCCDCEEAFDEASKLLAHFALHVVEAETTAIKDLLKYQNETNSIKKETSNINVTKTLPDLYPIKGVLSSQNKNYAETKIETPEIVNDNEKNSTSSNDSISTPIDQSEFDPLNFCSVSIDDSKIEQNKVSPKVKKKYHCNVCEKSFGWSTDLKRHLLIHSGLRPFKCQNCSATFTRKFLLKNHITKKHKTSVDLDIKNTIPKLKPIYKKSKDNFKDNFIKSELTLVQ